MCVCERGLSSLTFQRVSEQEADSKRDQEEEGTFLLQGVF